MLPPITQLPINFDQPNFVRSYSYINLAELRGNNAAHGLTNLSVQYNDFANKLSTSYPAPYQFSPDRTPLPQSVFPMAQIPPPQYATSIYPVQESVASKFGQQSAANICIPLLESNNSLPSKDNGYPQNYQLTCGQQFDSLNSHVNGNSILRPIVDANANLTSFSVEMVIDMGLFSSLAFDKNGSRFLQNNFPQENSVCRRKFYDAVLKQGLFNQLCTDSSGNFLVQKMIALAQGEEQKWITALLSSHVVELCCNRFSCRVIQKSLELLEPHHKGILILELCGKECCLATDQNGNHVIQKIISCLPPNKFKFIIDAFVTSEDTLKRVVQNKYGCRVVQLALEKLELSLKQVNASLEDKELYLKLITPLLKNCSSFAEDAFANYVIQHIIVEGAIPEQRDHIISTSILRNVLSLSQEKFASHVVERALEYAPAHLLRAMMDEVFDGYEKDKFDRDALDVLLFDQFGNYVVQKMFDISVDVMLKKREGRESWFQRLSARITRNEMRLQKYSSGKKLLERLEYANDKFGLEQPDENFNIKCKTSTIPARFR